MIHLIDPVVWFDGGVRKQNPGIPYGSFALSDTETDTEWFYTWQFDDDGAVSNNLAEYIALETMLDLILDYYTFDKLTIYGDSELIRNQIGKCIDGEWVSWKCNNLEFEPYIFYIRAKLQTINNWTYEHRSGKEVKKILGH
jgi:ribonuclease HI